MSRFESSHVRVEFVDNDTGQVVGHSQLLRSHLPDVPSRMKIGSDEWVVVTVQPGAASEVEEGGTLRLTVRRVVQLDTEELLFSAPTLCDRVPPLARGSRRGGTVLEVPEDDWRQVELVSLTLRREVGACLEAVRKVLVDERARVGWRGSHVRVEVPLPLPARRIPLRWVRERFGSVLTYDGVTYPNMQAMIEGGYAFAAGSGIQVYGRATAHKGLCVATLALRGWGESGDFLERDVAALVEIARANELALVDWCRGTFRMPHQFAAYFAHRSD